MPVIGLLGMPGAGKTTAMNALLDRDPDGFEIHGLQMKEIARQEYNTVCDAGIDYLPLEITDQAREEDREDELRVTGDFEAEISDWVDTVLDFDNTYFARCANEYLREHTADNSSQLWIIDGIRTVADVTTLQSLDTETHLVYLHTPFYTRAERVSERGRAGDDSVSKLLERDKQEFSWGLEQILSQFTIEWFIATQDSESEFEDEFYSFVTDTIET